MNPINEELFQAMLYKIASDPAVIESVSGNVKDELWLERQEVKRWYEERIEGVPGDEYISRCTQMVDWWLKISERNEETQRLFRNFCEQNAEGVWDAGACNDSEKDIDALKVLLEGSYKLNPATEQWHVLAQAVAECAVGSLIEINEEIAENVEAENLRSHFTAMRNFWDSFYDRAFSEESNSNDQNTSSTNSQSVEQSPIAQQETSQLASEEESTKEAAIFKKCSDQALESIQAGLTDKSHALNTIGGFSKIPDDFRFLGILRLGLESGHLSKEGLLLYACLNAYCLQLLRKFFIIQRNQNLESHSVEPSEAIQNLIDAHADAMQASLESEIEKRATACFHSLQDLQRSSPAAFRISFENQLQEAIDMALATLRDAVEQAKRLEASSAIQVGESMAAVMLAYAPMKLDDYEYRFSKAPWGFYELSNLCLQALEGIASKPRELLAETFTEWQQFYSNKMTNANNGSDSQNEQEESSEARFIANEEDMTEAFAELSQYLFQVLKQDTQLQDQFRAKTTLEILGFIRSEGYMQKLTTPEDLLKFYMSYDIDGLLKEALAAFAVPSTASEASPSTDVSGSDHPLVGSALTKQVRNLTNEPPESQARQCGYLVRGHPERGDVEAFYAALYEAYRAERN